MSVNERVKHGTLGNIKFFSGIKFKTCRTEAFSQPKYLVKCALLIIYLSIDHITFYRRNLIDRTWLLSFAGP